MIELAPGRALHERFAADLPPAAADAFALIEHRFGVLPLLEAFFEPCEAVEAAGRPLGALGLFTPAPAMRWCAAPVPCELADGALRLSGEVRIASPAAEGALVPVSLAGAELRLAWVAQDAPGVERRTAGPGAPCWLYFDGASVDPGLVSRPVTVDALHPFLEELAGRWAPAAAACAREGVRALRRAARTTARGGAAFNASQVFALSITEVEIEADLAAAAARTGGGLLAAAAAARTLESVAAASALMRDSAGLAIEGPFGEEGAGKSLTAFLGGALMLENEVARALGLPREAER